MFIIENIQTKLDANEFAAEVFEDTVDHEILIGKPEHYGVKVIAKDWFCFYLTDRKQFVSVIN